MYRTITQDNDAESAHAEAMPLPNETDDLFPKPNFRCARAPLVEKKTGLIHSTSPVSLLYFIHTSRQYQ